MSRVVIAVIICFVLACSPKAAEAPAVAPGVDDIRPLAADAGPDERLYRQAYELGSAGKPAEAEQLYLRILKEFPASRFLPDVWLALAEARFNRGDMDGALEAYRKIEGFADAKVLPFALYKQGWCWMNKADFARAQAAFERVVRLAVDGKPASKQVMAIVEEAKKDFAKAYAHAGAPDKAGELFARVGGSSAARMLDALGDAYFEQGKWNESAETFRELIAGDVASPKICDWQGRIVRATLSGGGKKEEVAEVQRLGAVYQRLAQTPGVAAAEVEACRKRYHDTTRELALLFHKEAQKTQDPAIYGLTDPLYREYLAHFEKEKDAYDMAFYYAELLFKLERWKDAAAQYSRVLAQDGKGKYAREAAYAAVISWKNALGLDDAEHAAGAGAGAAGAGAAGAGAAGGKPAPLSAGEEKLMAAFDDYLRLVPDAPEAPQILYRKARLFYEKGQYDKAAPLFLEVVDRFRDHELALYSVNLHLDSLNMQHKGKEVCVAVDGFLKTGPATRDPELGAQLKKLHRDCERLARSAGSKPAGGK